MMRRTPRGSSGGAGGSSARARNGRTIRRGDVKTITTASAATSVIISDCWFPDSVAACAPLVIVLMHVAPIPKPEGLSIVLALIPQPSIMQSGSNTTTIEMMIVMMSETLRMLPVAGTGSFR